MYSTTLNASKEFLFNLNVPEKVAQVSKALQGMTRYAQIHFSFIFIGSNI